MTGCRTQANIKSVLLATDFSEESALAVPCARRVCNLNNAKLYVVHVMDLFPFALSDMPEATANIEKIRKMAEEEMGEFLLANHLSDKSIESALISGEASTALEKFTDEHQIEMIVLGSRGDTGVGRLFAGSVAEEIFRTAQVPVIVAGPNLKANADNGSFDHLLFASDLGTVSRAAIPYLEFMLRQNPAAKLTLAHFLGPDSGNVYQRHQSRRRIEGELRDLTAPSFNSQIADVVVESCPSSEGILELAEGISADLLVLGVRSGGSFTRMITHDVFSTAPRVISKAPCPVLTVRAK